MYAGTYRAGCSYNAHHMLSLIGDPDCDPSMFERAFDDPKSVDWDKIYEGYDTAMDWPTVAFWETLSEKYPDAKIILTVRDAESWYGSATKTIFSRIMQEEYTIEGYPPHYIRCANMARKIAMDGTFGGPKNMRDKDAICKIFNEHVEYVKNKVPADRLLVLELGAGWEPLCAFLGKPVPDMPYPTSNSAEEFTQTMAERNFEKMAKASAAPAKA